MNLRPRPQEQPEIGLTPLIDVIFLLVIFFMVSTTFRKESELQVDLPEASPQPVQSERLSLEVAIDAAGQYAVNGKRLPDQQPNTLMRALEAIAGDDREQPFIIRADAQAEHQFVVRAMDIAGQLGFVRISIATVNMESGETD